MTKRRKAILILMLAAAAFYGLDDLSLITGIPPRPRYAVFSIDRINYVKEKFNKFSLEPQPPVDEQCVNSLLPHFGARPCWYVSRHRVVVIHVN